MVRSLRRRLSYANVMATLAVFVALGGSSYAALTVTSKTVRNNSLQSADIRNNTIRSADVRNGSLLAKDFRAGQLPAGAKGDAGGPGPAGERGPAGADGANGARGPARFVDVKWAWAPTQRSGEQGCTVQQEWRECAPVTVSVPANATYRISVVSSGSYFSFGAELPNMLSSCVSIRRSDDAFEQPEPVILDQAVPATCDPNGPEGITWERDNDDVDSEPRMANLTTTRAATLAGGASYVVSSAVWVEKHLSGYSPMARSPRVQTLVDIADVTP